MSTFGENIQLQNEKGKKLDETLNNLAKDIQIRKTYNYYAKKMDQIGGLF